MNERLYQPGDLLAFYGRDLVSRTIQLATWGPSHVGIVCELQGRLVLIESTTLCDLPCMIRGRPVAGVQAHLPGERIDSYPGSVWCHRLDSFWRLKPHQSAELTAALLHFADSGYDLRGAVWSGTKLLKWSQFLPYSDLGSLFCSELVAAALMAVGRLPIGNPGRYNPASLVRTLTRSCVYSRGFRLA